MPDLEHIVGKWPNIAIDPATGRKCNGEPLNVDERRELEHLRRAVQIQADSFARLENELVELRSKMQRIRELSEDV